ncbi:DUF4372 domain-containing protein [Stutzerimonas nitrititolerans]
MFSPIRLSHILQFIPRAAFNAAVKQSQADRYVKKVSSWDLLVAFNGSGDRFCKASLSVERLRLLALRW